MESLDSAETFLLEESSSSSSEDKKIDNKYVFTDASSGIGNLLEFESEIEQLELSDVLVHDTKDIVDGTAAITSEIRVQKQEEIKLQHSSEVDKETQLVVDVLLQYSSIRPGVTVVVTPQDLLDFATLNLLLVEGLSWQRC